MVRLKLEERGHGSSLAGGGGRVIQHRHIVA
jgi:hypothetical protein